MITLKNTPKPSHESPPKKTVTPLESVQKRRLRDVSACRAVEIGDDSKKTEHQTPTIPVAKSGGAAVYGTGEGC